MPEPNTPAIETLPVPSAPSEDKIVFHGEEETPETEAAAPPASEAETTEVIEPAKVELPGPAPAAQITTPPTPKPLETPPSLPLPSQEQLQQFYQLLAQQQEVIQRQAASLAQQQEATEVAQLRAAWEDQGYTEEQIQAGLAQQAQIKQRERTVAQREQALNQTLGQHQAEVNAKVTVATMLSEKYGMPFAELMKLNNPHVMEARAEAYQARQELAKAQQAKVKPHKLDTVGPGQQAATSRTRLLDRYNAGERLTPEQENALFSGR